MAELNPPEGPYVLTGPATDVEANKLRTSSAAFRRMLAASLQSQGGISLIGDLKVSATGTDVNITIATGDVFVMGTLATDEGMYHGRNSGAKVIPLLTNNPAHATLDRIDVVVARINDTFYTGALDTFSLEMVTGTPSGSPAVPALPANSIALAQILIVHATTVVNPANITDKRVLAGLMPRRIAFLSGALATYDYQNIPPMPGSLEAQFSLRSTSGVNGLENHNLTFNGDNAGTTYSQNNARVAGTAAIAPSENLNSAAIFITGVGGASPGTFRAAGRILIPNYTALTPRAVDARWGSARGQTTGLMTVEQTHGVWNNTAAAINRLTWTPTTGFDALSYCSLWWYPQ